MVTLFLDDGLVNTAPISCLYHDYAGGQSDALEVTVDDVDGEVKSINPIKGMTMQAYDGDVDSGVMYISDIRHEGNLITLRGLALPVNCGKSKNGYWNSVGFLELVTDLADEAGLGFKLLDMLSVTYKDVTRMALSPIQMLQTRMTLEGYGVKIHDGTLFIYSEKAREQAMYTEMYYLKDFISDPSFSTSDAGLVSRVENSYRTYSGQLISTVTESGLDGKVLMENIPVSSIDESERFSKGLMRAANRMEYTGILELDGLERRAGQTVYMADAPGNHAGTNYIYAAAHDLVDGTQRLYVRRPIKGGY